MCLHDSSSGVPLGQNHPTSVIATGIEPQTIAQGEKIDQISSTVVAIAASSGQIELRGEASRASGSAAAREVTTNSRRSTRNPLVTGNSSGCSHSGFDPLTTGMRAKL